MDAFQGANARTYVRNTLIFTLVISIIANITEAYLATSEISLWLRIPGAAVWPILAFRAIEILIRMMWERRFSHYLTRSLILIPGIPAIIVSYAHQYSLLIAMGETGIVPIVGPIAIDGLMIGCTLAILVTRPREVSEVPAEVSEVDEVVEQAEEITREAAGAPAQRARKPRNESGPALAVTALRDGATVAEAALLAGLGQSTTRKYAAVLRELNANPNADLGEKARGLRQDVIDDIRSHARGLASR